MPTEKLGRAKSGRIQQNDIRAGELTLKQVNELHITLDQRQALLRNPSSKQGAGKHTGARPQFDDGRTIGRDPRRNNLSQRRAGRSYGTDVPRSWSRARAKTIRSVIC